MWRKILAAVLVMVMVLSFVSCNNMPSVAEVIGGMEGAAGDITSVSCDMDASLNMDVDAGDESVYVDAAVSMSSVMDIENTQMQMEADINFTSAEGEGSDSSISMDIAVAFYLLDDMAYMMLDEPFSGATWESQQLQPEDIQQMEEMLGGQLNPAGMQDFLMEIADVVLDGKDDINGVSCYRLKLALDADKVEQKIVQLDQESGGSMSLEDIDREMLDKVIQGISITQWVAEDTYYTMKVQVTIDIELAPEDIGYAEEAESIVINASFEALFYDYNEPVNIVLPPEAEEAAGMMSSPMKVDMTLMTAG